jgi:uncharacterized protein (DUF488 family)
MKLKGATIRSRAEQKPLAMQESEIVGIDTLLTIGHSTRSIDEFIELLKGHGIKEIVDVRTVPKSRHCPQFNSDSLSESLRKAKIRYAHIEKLGGLRHSRKDSINLGWRNASFRGYADYMATPEFSEGLGALTRIARSRKTAIMCAEAVPWRCHRSLIADAMTVKGFAVRDILSAKAPSPHRLTPFLKVVNGQLTYPAAQETQE